MLKLTRENTNIVLNKRQRNRRGNQDRIMQRNCMAALGTQGTRRWQTKYK